MMTDAELLLAYAFRHDQPAFAEFVRRYVDFVYAAARRQLGNRHHPAQEVTQSVFAAIARRATSLARHPRLVAWIYLHTRFQAAHFRRSEQRRVARETAYAQAMTLESRDDPLVDPAQLLPWIDETLAQLREQERLVLLMRYFRQQSYAQMGEALGLAENAVRMRTERALDKVRRTLASRGITSSTAVVALALTHATASAAPAGLAAMIAQNVATLQVSAAPWLPLLMHKTTSTVAVLTVVAGVAGLSGWQLGQAGSQSSSPPSPPPAVVADTRARLTEQADTIAALEAALQQAQVVEVIIPLNATELAVTTGKVQRKLLQFKERYPRPPVETSGEYDTYLGELRTLLLELVPVQAQVAVAQRNVGTAQGAASFQTDFLTAALELNATQRAQVAPIFNKYYTRFFQENFSWAGRPSGDASVWQAARRKLNAEAVAEIRTVLSPLQQLYLRQLGADTLLFYTNLSLPNGVQY